MNEIEGVWGDLGQNHQCELSGAGSPDLSMTIHMAEHLRGWCPREMSWLTVLACIDSSHYPWLPHSFKDLWDWVTQHQNTLCLYDKGRKVGTADGSSAAPNSTAQPNSSYSLKLANCWHPNTKGLHVFLKVRLTWSAVLDSGLGRAGDGFCIWRHVQPSFSLRAEHTKHPLSRSELHLRIEGCNWICFILQIDDC